MGSFVLAIVLILTTTLVLWWNSGYHQRKKAPPGPIPLPIIGNLHLLGNLPHRALHKLSLKYGPIMSIGLGSINAIVISSADAAKPFLGTHDSTFASRPKLQASKYFYSGKGILLTEYGPYLQNVKKLCNVELLSTVKIDQFAEMRREEVGLMVEEIRVASMANQVVNLREVVGDLIEGMTCRMLFGRKYDHTFVFKKIFSEIMEVVGIFNMADYVPMLAAFDLQGVNRIMSSLSKETNEMLETLINEHEVRSVTKQQGCDQMNFIDILLSLKSKYSNSHQNKSTMIDRSDMKAILFDMIVGAIDTSITSIEWVLSALIRHPRVMKKLQNELKTIIGHKEMVDETDLRKLSYLHMVVKETFRLYPPAAFLVPHEAIEDTMINGYDIPKKTQVIVNVWAFGRVPKVWSDNWVEFLPERFLYKEIEFRGPDLQLMYFSTGRRGCPGMNLGLLNIGLAVSNLVHHFDWVLPNGMSPNELDMDEKFGLTIPKVTPLLAIPSYRSHDP